MLFLAFDDDGKLAQVQSNRLGVVWFSFSRSHRQILVYCGRVRSVKSLKQMNADHIGVKNDFASYVVSNRLVTIIGPHIRRVKVRTHFIQTAFWIRIV